jgi:4-aminobutyrate aminotransferase-like enzyme
MTSLPSHRLESGDQLPDVRTSLPGPRAQSAARRLDAAEAPGINTLVDGGTAMLWEEALGSNVLDIDGNRYIDLTAGFGVAAVGHRHPAVVSAVKRQADRLIHGLGDVYAHPMRLELAERLCKLAPMDETRAYFAASGADAVEIALKTGRLYSGRSEVLTFTPAYHGTTLGALQGTSRPAFRTPFTEPLDDLIHRLPHGAGLEDLQRVLDRHPAIGTCLIEPVIGREATRWPPSDWLAGVAAACRKHDVVLAVDEIFTAFGRCGAWFVSTEVGIEPDLICCGKALGGGLPIAAVLGKNEVMASWQTQGEARHTATFVAHPLACAAALATLDVIENEGLIQRAQEVGGRFGLRLEPLKQQRGIVDVRGTAMLWGVELDGRERAAGLCRHLLERGVLALGGGASGTVLQIAPPLVVTERQLDYAADSLIESASSA